MQTTALEKQLAFLREIDQLKFVIRQSPLLDKGREKKTPPSTPDTSQCMH